MRARCFLTARRDPARNHDLVPYAKIRVAHGRINGKKLEKIMLEFINNEFDILLSTTIIESGLDVPNANTIFINNAQNFGLSDLHQMRGRVGRSNKKAFCYFITPPLNALASDAHKRIKAIEQVISQAVATKIMVKSRCLAITTEDTLQWFRCVVLPM